MVGCVRPFPGFEVSRGSVRSVLVARKRLHRIRRRFDRCIHISKVLRRPTSLSPNSSKFQSRVAPSSWHAAEATTRPQTYPERPPVTNIPTKKVVYLGPTAPRPRKKRQLPEPPSSRRSGLVGPYTTPPIVNYKYRTSTRREGYFGLPTLGS